MIRRLMMYALAVAFLIGTAEAKEYSAERFDSRIEVARGGLLKVTETVLLKFEEGAFTQFYREIPSRRTDGIQVVSAAMDGTVLPPGDGPGQVEINGSSRTRVTWRFAKVSGSSHLFQLTYLVRGAARRIDGADLIAWRALPEQHAYRIDSATIEIELPVAPLEKPGVELRRVGDSSVEVHGTRVAIIARTVGRNGWIEAWIRLPMGSVIDAAPGWQQRELRRDQTARLWFLLAGVVFMAGAALLFAVRQGYDAPPHDITPPTAGPAPPDTLPPALAGALISNGRPRLEHAMAALFSLADRDELTIEEQPRALGQRSFVVTRRSSGRPLAEHEERALGIIFSGRDGAETSITLGKARQRLTRQFSKFSAAVEHELAAAGLLDDSRRSVRKRFFKLGLAAVVAAVIAAVPLPFLFDEHGVWPMLIALALGIVGATAFVCSAAHTPLSNEAVRRAQYWRGYRKYLSDVAHDRATTPGESTARQLLPFAVAVGLASTWASYLKRHRGGAPAWFRAAAERDTGHAFAAFVATGGAGDAHAGAGGAGGGGGAAGGGASGAS